MDLQGENSGDSVELKNLQFLSMPNIFDLPDQFTVTDPTAVLNGAPTMPVDNTAFLDNLHPRVVIVEQPQQRGFRFRYECEGPCHGGLQGEKSEPGNKTYPSIRIENYEGPARIEVSLVTDENPPRIHAHKLVGKNCKEGLYIMNIRSTASVISFPSLSVQHIKKKKAAEALEHRILEDIKLNKQLASTDPTQQPHITAEESLMAKKQAHEQARSMVLSAVRLQFRVFLPNAQGDLLDMLPPVVSKPIHDNKHPGASALKICRMDKYGGCCSGNEEVFLLCEKVQKEDIAVKFVEYNPDGSVKWEAYGSFSPLDVHRQFAIVFKTPPYMNTNIDRAVQVMIMLQRLSDKEVVSQGKPFTYYPRNLDKDLIARKKRKTLPMESTFSYYQSGGGPETLAATLGPMQGGNFGGLLGVPGSSGVGHGLGLRPVGGGGAQPSHSNYHVIMPDGNIVDQLNVLPTTVEQAVKEEFARSPETINVEELYQQDVLANPLETNAWSSPFDLEIDAAPSLRYQSHLVTTTRLAASSSLKSKPDSCTCLKVEKPCEHDTQSKDPEKETEKGPESKDPDNEKATGSENDEQKHSVADKLTSLETAMDRLGADWTDSTLQENEDSKATRKDGTQHTAENRAAAAAQSDELKPPNDSENEQKQSQHKADKHTAMSSIVDSGTGERREGRQQAYDRTLLSDNEGSRGGRGGRRENTAAASPPCRLSEVLVSEGGRTDEGFSEVSELSGREDCQEPKKAFVPPPPERQREGREAGDQASRTVKAATAVVKRVVQRVMSKTVLALRDYAETGDPRYLLLVQRHLTAIRNENGDLPLHLAIINNQTTALRHLLAVMMSMPGFQRIVNTHNYIRQTALHLAAIMLQPLHIELLLHAGADPSIPDRNGNTPAHLAVLNNSLEGLRSLVKYLRPGVSASNPFPELDYLNYDGYSPVHLAAQRGYVDMLQLLVHGQADVDIGDGKSGRTALHHAVEMDDLPVAGFLLMEANADVNARCFDGNTPLHVACCRGLVGMVALLMTAGALTDVENEEVPPEDSEGGDGERERKEEDEGRSRRYRRGLQPRDYVVGKDSQRILRMLMGDLASEEQNPASTELGPLDDSDPRVYSGRMDDPSLADNPDHEESCHSYGKGDLEQDLGSTKTHKSSYDSGVADNLFSQSAPSLQTKEKLSREDQVALSKLLDPEDAGKDVLELASRLGYSTLVPALQVMASSGSSPTLYLLDYNETYGSLSKLRECLQAMERDDALKVLGGHL